MAEVADAAPNVVDACSALSGDQPHTIGAQSHDGKDVECSGKDEMRSSASLVLGKVRLSILSNMDVFSDGLMRMTLPELFAGIQSSYPYKDIFLEMWSEDECIGLFAVLKSPGGILSMMLSMVVKSALCIVCGCALLWIVDWQSEHGLSHVSSILVGAHLPFIGLAGSIYMWRLRAALWGPLLVLCGLLVPLSAGQVFSMRLLQIDSGWKERHTDMLICLGWCLGFTPVGPLIFMLPNALYPTWTTWKKSLTQWYRWKMAIPVGIFVATAINIAMLLMWACARLRGKIMLVPDSWRPVVILAVNVALACFAAGESIFIKWIGYALFRRREALESEGVNAARLQTDSSNWIDWLLFMQGFLLKFGAKTLATTLSSWQSVLVVSLLQMLIEVLSTAGLVLWSCRSAQRAAGKQDASLMERGQYALSVHIIKYVSDIEMEYIITGIAILAAVIFRNSKLIVGFGSYQPEEGVKVLAAQFVPEFLSDFIGLALMKANGVNVFQFYWESRRDWVLFLAKPFSTLTFLCFTVLSALCRPDVDVCEE